MCVFNYGIKYFDVDVCAHKGEGREGDIIFDNANYCWSFVFLHHFLLFPSSIGFLSLLLDLKRERGEAVKISGGYLSSIQDWSDQLAGKRGN